MTNTKSYLSANDVALLREAAENVERGDLDAFGDDLPDFLAFLLRSFANGRDRDVLNYRVMQLARCVVKES